VLRTGFLQVLRTGHVIPDMRQAVCRQPAGPSARARVRRRVSRAAKGTADCRERNQKARSPDTPRLACGACGLV